MTQDEFRSKLENIVYRMDTDEYIELLQTIGIGDADYIKPMDEFDSEFDDTLPSELYEIFSSTTEFNITDAYYLYDGGYSELISFDDPKDMMDYDIDVVTERIETDMNSFGVAEIQALIDEFTTITEDEVLDKILEAMEQRQTVTITIDGTEFTVKRKETGNGDE